MSESKTKIFNLIFYFLGLKVSVLEKFISGFKVSPFLLLMYFVMMML